MVERLADDHARARRLADALADRFPGSVDPDAVATNIVCARARPRCPTDVRRARSATHGRAARARSTPRTVRFVTHKDVDDAGARPRDRRARRTIAERHDASSPTDDPASARSRSTPIPTIPRSRPAARSRGGPTPGAEVWRAHHDPRRQGHERSRRRPRRARARPRRGDGGGRGACSASPGTSTSTTATASSSTTATLRGAIVRRVRERPARRRAVPRPDRGVLRRRATSTTATTGSPGGRRSTRSRPRPATRTTSPSTAPTGSTCTTCAPCTSSGTLEPELLGRHHRHARAQDRRAVLPREPADRDRRVVPRVPARPAPRRPAAPPASPTPKASAASRSASRRTAPASERPRGGYPAPQRARDQDGVFCRGATRPSPAGRARRRCRTPPAPMTAPMHGRRAGARAGAVAGAADVDQAVADHAAEEPGDDHAHEARARKADRDGIVGGASRPIGSSTRGDRTGRESGLILMCAAGMARRRRARRGTDGCAARAQRAPRRALRLEHARRRDRRRRRRRCSPASRARSRRRPGLRRHRVGGPALRGARARGRPRLADARARCTARSRTRASCASTTPTASWSRPRSCRLDECAARLAPRRAAGCTSRSASGSRSGGGRRPHAGIRYDVRGTSHEARFDVRRATDVTDDGRDRDDPARRPRRVLRLGRAARRPGACAAGR